uniref:Uncharacterized protein n=1 Tax=Panagrolaimus davidi TaxID=227884 RepID=A0A914QEJ5_9BILA
MAERQNNSSGGSNSSKKNESRFSQSPLNSEKKKRSKKADDSTNNGPIPKAMKYKPKTPPPAKENVKSPEEETESEGTTRENGPKVTVQEDQAKHHL